MPADTAISKRSAQAGLAAAIVLLIACLIVLILGGREARAADRPEVAPRLSAPASDIPASRNPASSVLS